MDDDRSLPFDPFEEPDFKELSRVALEDGLASLRHLSFFHTLDLLESTPVREAHRWVGADPGFPELVAAWLLRNAFRCGVQGPLAGEPHLGDRWTFYDEAASPSEP